MEIHHLSGQDIKDETLSGIEVIIAPVTHDALAAAQDDDDELQTLLMSKEPDTSKNYSSHAR